MADRGYYLDEQDKDNFLGLTRWAKRLNSQNAQRRGRRVSPNNRRNQVIVRGRLLYSVQPDFNTFYIRDVQVLTQDARAPQTVHLSSEVIGLPDAIAGFLPIFNKHKRFIRYDSVADQYNIVTNSDSDTDTDSDDGPGPSNERGAIVYAIYNPRVTTKITNNVVFNDTNGSPVYNDETGELVLSDFEDESTVADDVCNWEHLPFLQDKMFGRMRHTVGVASGTGIFDYDKLIYAGFPGHPDFDDEYDWRHGDNPEDLALWGIGSANIILPGTDEEVGSKFGSALHNLINLTGRWIFKDSCVTITEGQYITDSDSPTVVIETRTFEGDSFFSGADGWSDHFPDPFRNILEMPSDYEILDPMGIRGGGIDFLESQTDGDPTHVFFVHVTGRTTSNNSDDETATSELCLTCIGSSVQGGGTQGPPGEDGEDGEEGPIGPAGPAGADGTLVYLMRASVNTPLNDVSISNTSFNFDGGVSVIGFPTSPTATGTCSNPGRAFTNNENILVFSANGTDWQAVKLSNNIIQAEVDGVVSNTDTEFDFDTDTPLVGEGPGTLAPVAINSLSLAWANNEKFLAIQRDDGDWEPFKLNHYIRIKGAPDSTVSAQDTSFTVTTYTALQGSLPTGALTVFNTAKIPIATSETNTEYHYNINQQRWETLPRKSHAVFGFATADVPGTSPFNIDGIGLINGSDPRTNPSNSAETLSVSNPFAFIIPNNALVFAEKLADLSWAAYQVPPSGTDQTVFRFQTTESKSWDQDQVMAELLDSADTPIGGTITLKDRDPAKHEAQPGSRGWCVLINGEFYIITMDSPARWIEGTLTANWGINSTTGTIVVEEYWGASPNHLEPLGESSEIEVEDTINLRGRVLFAGETIRALWDETRETYLLAQAPSMYVRVKGTSPGVTRDATTFSLSTPTAVIGRSPGITLTVKCVVPMNAPSGRTVFADFDASAGSTLATVWNNASGGNFIYHLRGLLNGYEGRQLVDHHDDDDPEWHNTMECSPSTDS